MPQKDLTDAQRIYTVRRLVSGDHLASRLMSGGISGIGVDFALPL
jgi:hypothetical protein